MKTRNFSSAIGVVASFLIFGFANSAAAQMPGAPPKWSIGDRKAPVVIEVFSDYQCKRCALYNDDVKRIHEKYGDRVRIIFRQFPITEIHKGSLLAAQASEAAGKQSRFFQMNDLLYQRANQWAESKTPSELFVSYAKELKLNEKRFRHDLSGKKVAKRIRLDVERARYLNLPGTPTVVIDGGRSFHEDLADLDSVIDDKLKADQKK